MTHALPFKYLTLLPAAALLWLCGACSDGSVGDGPLTDGADSDAGGSLSFRLAPETLASRAVTYSGLEASFTEGTLIGCIIARVEADGTPVYIANTAWEYHPDGLLLNMVLDEDNDDYNTLTNNPIINLKYPTATDITRYELKFGSDFDYAFYFYYPYIDEYCLPDELSAYITNGNINISKVPYPNISDRNDKSWGDVTNTYHEIFDVVNDYFYNSPPGGYDVLDPESDRNIFKRADWRQYPVTPAIDFDTKTDGDCSRIEKSDFMWAALTSWNGMPINAVNTRDRVSVSLTRQLAVIDLVFAERPSEVYLLPKESEVAQYTYRKMPRRKDFDLMTGQWLDNDYTDIYEKWYSAGPVSENLKRASSAYDQNSPVYPQYIGVSNEWVGSGNADFHTYRLLMMPQANLSCDIKMTIDGRQYTLTDLQRNPKLASLEGGTYYKIRFSKTGDDTGWHLEIDDWNSGDSMTLPRP